MGAKFASAYKAGLSSVTPKAEDPRDQFAINGSVMAAQVAADNALAFSFLDLQAKKVVLVSLAASERPTYVAWHEKIKDVGFLATFSKMSPFVREYGFFSSRGGCSVTVNGRILSVPRE